MKLLHNTPSIPISAVSAMNLGAIIDELPPFQQNWLRENNFDAALGKSFNLSDKNGNLDRIMFGLGDANALRRSRLYFGGLPNRLPPFSFHFVESREFCQTRAALAWMLGSYQFTEYAGQTKELPNLVVPDFVDKLKIEAIAKACYLAQDLINHPANVMTPDRLEAECVLMAKRYQCTTKVIRGDELLTQNFPLIHAVGRASEFAPRLVEFKWGKANDPKITLVGKGVCFDTGGLNIKPGSSMGLMKKDMGGAANVLGLAQMIMELGLPIQLRVLIPAVENSISSNAFRPSDIYTARDGQTVEINNTDAEGRLVLADALALASEDDPELIISMATLTGAARVALGPDLMPYFTNDEGFAANLEPASRKVEDPVWRLPFWEPYEPMIEPGIANLDNAPAGGMAGAITAALFLKRFTKRHRYAHFDIYGWTPVEKPGRPKGGAAQAIRAIFETLNTKYGANND